MHARGERNYMCVQIFQFAYVCLSSSMAYVCRILEENCRRFSRRTYVYVSWYVPIWSCTLSWISKANFVECHCYGYHSLASPLHVVCTSWDCNCSCSILFTFVYKQSLYIQYPCHRINTVDVIPQYWIYMHFNLQSCSFWGTPNAICITN